MTGPPNRRRFLQAGVLGAVGLGLAPWLPQASAEPAEETLYNGIRLPSPWPPRLGAVSFEPMSPPYLAAPPAVIPIDVGRQLFVDDFLIEQTTLQRTFYPAKYHPDNPILKPEQPWEKEGEPTAMVFSDGVWYDPGDRLFKIWYMGGYTRSTCHATSADGVRWEKPALDVKKDSNVVQTTGRDSTTVWLDLEEKDPKRRYKLFLSRRAGNSWALDLHFAPDGIHWGEPAAQSGPCGDRTTVFYNPFRKVWVFSLRGNDTKLGRIRHYWENADVLAGAAWKAGEPLPWVGADRLDPQRDDLKTPPQLYNLDAVAYESVLLGLFTIWRGQPKDRAKPNEVCVGFSRDGFHWTRPVENKVHRPLLAVSEQYGDWNWANVQSAGGCCLVVGEQLYFYVSGRAGVRGSATSGVSSTGLAVLRRDGFASMDAGSEAGTLTTRPLSFRGKHLFVNAEAKGGEVRVEVLDGEGKVVAPFTRENCEPLRGDGTLQAVRWQGGHDLAGVAGKPLKFRFHVQNAKLYAFWVSPEASGASHGYVAAGGPGFAGATDTVRGEGLPK
jgi:hypothetical protein